MFCHDVTATLDDIGAREWKTLFAAQLGWMLDGMDVMLYAFALTTIQKEFGLTSAIGGSARVVHVDHLGVSAARWRGTSRTATAARAYWSGPS